MKFRPCIDIHNGKVKQIVGGSLKDLGDQAEENFISEKDAAFYAHCYQKDGLTGGHVILLNPKTSPYYEETKRQALLALSQAIWLGKVCTFSTSCVQRCSAQVPQTPLPDGICIQAALP